ncbi:MAG: hypothetical protein ACPIB6_07275 [Henriciella sp.]
MKKISQKDVLIDAHSLMSHFGRHFSVILSQNKSSMVIPVEFFITVPRLEFLERIASDEMRACASSTPFTRIFTAGCRIREISFGENNFGISVLEKANCPGHQAMQIKPPFIDPAR